MNPSTTLGHAVARVLRAVGSRRHRDDPRAWLEAAISLMRSATYCTLITSADTGPTARVVQPFWPTEDLIVHLGTDPTSRKASEIETSGTAVLVYQRDRDRACVVAYCQAELLPDAASRRRYFMPVWRAFWPKGPDESSFVVVRCVPYALEIWDARRGITPPPFGLRSARLERDKDGRWQPAPSRP